MVSSSSPPDSHGVGSTISEMCTHRTALSTPASPATNRTSRSRRRSRRASTVLQIVDRHTPIRPSLPAHERRRGSSVPPRDARLRPHGSGPPLLLVHGLGMCKEVWRPVAAAARARARGGGGRPAGLRRLAARARRPSRGWPRRWRTFAAELGLERPHVAGNSLGGGVALTMGARARRGRSARCRRSASSPAARRRTGARCSPARAGGRARSPRWRRRSPAAAVLRTLLSAHAAARPWRIPPEDAAHWARVFAQAPAFWDLLSARRLARAGAGLPDHRRLGRARPPADLLPPGAARAPRLPEPRHVVLRGCGHVPDLGRPGAGRERAAQRFTAS